ncbi:MAG: MFS family permease [Candidatus Azotimanducaceae bacterium]
MTRPSGLSLYLFANSTWFLAFGIQMVVFAWLITIELNESPTRVGIAQMALLLPTLIFILIGGSLSDRYGGRNVAIVGQSCAAIGPLVLTIAIVTGHLNFQTVIIFALWMGIAQALVTPARDGLLSQLAGGQIQKLVIIVSMIQFGIQVVGFLIAANADQLGAVVVLGSQSGILIVGIIAYLFLRVDEQLKPVSQSSLLQHLRESIFEGFRTVRATPALLTVTIQNLAMGMFLMGSFIVTLPLLIRQNYDGTSAELAWVNTANAVGLFLSTMVLWRLGGVKRPGRALILSLAMAGILLGLTTYVTEFRMLLMVVFMWGAAGGLVMTMSRSIMQEKAPADQRGRIMAVFSLSFMGAGLFGSLLNGYLVEQIRAEGALLVSTVGILVSVSAVAFVSSLWSLESDHKAG